MPRAVLDSNAFISSIISPVGNPARILRAWRGEAFELIVSEPILKELEQVLEYPRIRKLHGWSGMQVREFIEELRLLTVPVNPVPLEGASVRDPEDRKFLEAAVAGEADFVVSGDEDLLALGEHRVILIVSPAAFLRALEDLASPS